MIYFPLRQIGNNNQMPPSTAPTNPSKKKKVAPLAMVFYYFK